MSVDKTQVAKIAHLARVKVDDDRLTAMTDELNGILAWVEQLGEVDTADVPPMTSVVEAKLHWREDHVTDGNKTDEILANAPHAEYGFFAVPKVIE